VGCELSAEGVIRIGELVDGSFKFLEFCGEHVWFSGEPAFCSFWHDLQLLGRYALARLPLSGCVIPCVLWSVDRPQDANSITADSVPISHQMPATPAQAWRTALTQSKLWSSIIPPDETQ
jgi:hypothetical protein